MTAFSRLTRIWVDWAARIGMTKAAVSPAPTDTDVGFTSDDQSFYLREMSDWWSIDVVNDRGRRYTDTARFSTFELAEKFLIWRWGTLLRSALGAPLNGPELYASGPNAAVTFHPTDTEWFFELQSDAGRARLAEPSATIFSHLMSKSVDELEQMATDGIL